MLDRAPVSDGLLLRRIATGDAAAAQQLYARHSTSLYALAYALLMDSEDADRVVQETFDRARLKAAEFDADGGAAYQWLSQIARSIALGVAVTRRAEKVSGQFSLIWPG